MKKINKTRIILVPVGVSIGSLEKDIAKTLNRMAPNNFRFEVKTYPNVWSIPTPYEMNILGKCEGDKIKEKCQRHSNYCQAFMSTIADSIGDEYSHCVFITPVSPSSNYIGEYHGKFSICKLHSDVKLTILHELYHRYVGTEHCNNACIMQANRAEKPLKRFCKDCKNRFRKALERKE